MQKPKYKIGDIVFLKSTVMEINWKFSKFLDYPFVIVALPVDTEQLRTYTIRLLDDESNEDCWVDYKFHEAFFFKGDSNA